MNIRILKPQSLKNRRKCLPPAMTKLLPLAAQPTSLLPEGSWAKVVQELLLGWNTSMLDRKDLLLPSPPATKSLPSTTALLSGAHTPVRFAVKTLCDYTPAIHPLNQGLRILENTRRITA